MARETKAELCERIVELEIGVQDLQNRIGAILRERAELVSNYRECKANLIGSIAIAHSALIDGISPYNLCAILLHIAQEAPDVLMEAAKGVVDPLEVNPGAKRKILNFLGEGKKIQAIKVYRDVTGSGLKEAKDAVEKIEEKLEQIGRDR